MLTEKRIRDAKPGPKTVILWDGQVKGLGLRITPKGTKSFILNYRADGRERRITLARASEISLKGARERAGAELVAIRAGEADPLERRRQALEAPTVNEAMDRFFGKYCPARIKAGRMSPRTQQEYRKQGARWIRPDIGERRVADIRRLDIEKLVDGIEAPVARNRVLALLSRLFSWFEQQEYRELDTNPCRRIERTKETPRERILTPAELAGLNEALGEQSNPAAVAAIRVAAMTGLRISEVLAMQWEHLDFESGRVVLPHTKTGRRIHDLPAAVLALIDGLPRINGNPYVFTMWREAAVTYKTVRGVFSRASEQAGLMDVRLHDLRRTALTTAAMAGFPALMVKELAGHKTLQMASRYVQLAGSDPVKSAREQVGATIAAAMEGKSSVFAEKGTVRVTGSD